MNTDPVQTSDVFIQEDWSSKSPVLAQSVALERLPPPQINIPKDLRPYLPIVVTPGRKAKAYVTLDVDRTSEVMHLRLDLPRDTGHLKLDLSRPGNTMKYEGGIFSVRPRSRGFSIKYERKLDLFSLFLFMAVSAGWSMS